MTLSLAERQKLINDVAKASGIDGEILNSKMTDQQLIVASQQLEILLLFRYARKDTELTEEKYQCKSCNTITRMIVLSQPTLLSDDKMYQDGFSGIPLLWWKTYAHILICPSCSKVNVLTVMYSNDRMTEPDSSGTAFYVPDQTTFRLTDRPLKEEVQEQIELEKLHNQHLHHTIHLIDEFIEGTPFQNYLLKLLKELEIAIENQSEFSTRILCGAITEALLFYIFRPKKSNLSQLIDLAKNQNILSENGKQYVDQIRYYRNTVHYDNWEKSQLQWNNNLIPIIINTLELLTEDIKNFISQNNTSS